MSDVSKEDSLITKNKHLTSLILSKSFNPWLNLAVEEHLLNTVKCNEIILYLWQNKDTVVIGSNQNPWKECDVELIKSQGVKLARRLSGGGTVYHDIGNLNFTFVMGKELYDLNQQLSVILKTVNSFGLKAEFTGRNDIAIDGKKFSGNAYFFGDNASYHHGTLLVDVNVNKLSSYLKPSKQKIESKGIDSVRSRVVNLKAMNQNISVDKLKNKMVDYFSEVYGEISRTSEFDEEIKDHQDIVNLYKKYASWEWIYGESPSFDAYYENRFNWGEVQIGFKLMDGVISDVKVYSDSLHVDFVTKLTNALKGVRYEVNDIKKAIKSIETAEKKNSIFNDILLLF